MMWIYASAFITSILFRRRELLITAFLLPHLSWCMQSHGSENWSQFAITTGGVMTITEYICVRGFQMWTYRKSLFHVPLWVPLMWSIRAFFVVDLFLWFVYLGF